MGVLTTAICAAVIAAAQADIYYVDPNGSDMHPGTEARPWASVDHGDSLGPGVLKPGDTVVVRAGHYDVSGNAKRRPDAGVTLTSCSGTPGLPITYVAEGSVVLDRGAGRGLSLLSVGGVHDIVLDGFEFAGGKGQLQINQGSDWEIRNCRFSGKTLEPGYPAVYFWICDGDILFHHNIVDGRGGVEGPGIWVTNGPGRVRCYNNTLVGVTGSAIRADKNGLVVARNNILANMVGLPFEGGSLLECSHNLVFRVESPAEWRGEEWGPPLYADPGFRDPEHGDFSLLPDSSAIDAGTLVGLAFEGTRPDLGARESPSEQAPSDVTELSGCVLDSATSDPLPGAEVRIGNVTTRTDADGCYRAIVPTGLRSISVTASSLRIGNVATHTNADGCYRAMVPTGLRSISVTANRLGQSYTPVEQPLELVPGKAGKDFRMVRELTYYSELNGAISRRNGLRYYNRPLYFDRMPGFVLASDRPHLSVARTPSDLGRWMAAFVRDGKAAWLHDFSQRLSSYQGGWMSWTLEDEAFEGVRIQLQAVPLASEPGAAVRLQVQGAREGDVVLWACGGGKTYPASEPVSGALDALMHPALTERGFAPEDCSRTSVRIQGGAFLLGPAPPENGGPDSQRLVVKCGSPQSILTVGDAASYADPAVLAGSRNGSLPLAVGKTTLGPGSQEVFWSLVVLDSETSGNKGPEPSPDERFHRGLSHAVAVGNRVEVNTPDDMLNAAVRVSNHALDGLIRPPVIMHGGMMWRMPYQGWRTLYGPTAAGWHDDVRAVAEHYLASQVTDDTNREPHADPAKGHSEEALDSRFYGRGRVALHNHMYHMQSVFFDMLIHAWRSTGDSGFQTALRSGLELHLDYIRDCFDADGNGVYESYMNTAEIDGVWYSGSETVEESAYAFTAHRAAAEMALAAGDEQNAQRHTARAREIAARTIESLWIPTKGHMGAYREQLGNNRRHEDPWLYSIFLPIEAGMLTPYQAAQNLHFTEWGLQRDKTPWGGEICWTSNWVPGHWSNRMIWPAHGYSLAIAYCRAGLPLEAWRVFSGRFVDSFYNQTVPAGSAAVGTDFHEEVSMFSRAVVEGLFGYRPDYPAGVVSLAPQFPPDWDHASISTPDFSLEFSGQDERQEYRFRLTKSAKVHASLPVSARRIVAVLVDGEQITYTVEPGFGRSEVLVRLPVTSSARISVVSDEVLPFQPPLHAEGEVGHQVEIPLGQAELVSVSDPQGALSSYEKVNDHLRLSLAPNPGHHMVFPQVRTGDLEQSWIVKLRTLDSVNEARDVAERTVEVSTSAEWACVDMKNAVNGDVREIFKQSYMSPRPKTCSVRLGADGYSSWTYYHWGINVPEIDLANVPGAIDDKGRIGTPQGVPFLWPEGNGNIAFTSQWDNWPQSVTVPIGRAGDAVWFLVCGSTNPMQTRIANAQLRMTYADGTVEFLDLVPPVNFWSLCPIAGGHDYDYGRDGFCLPEKPPPMVHLGSNCRAMVLVWRLRPDVVLEAVTLETLSQEVVIGLMGITVMGGGG